MSLAAANGCDCRLSHLSAREQCASSSYTLIDVKPSFDNDANIVPIPPREAAFSNCKKVIERDVELHRKNAQPI